MRIEYSYVPAATAESRFFTEQRTQSIPGQRPKNQRKHTMTMAVEHIAETAASLIAGHAKNRCFGRLFDKSLGK